MPASSLPYHHALHRALASGSASPRKAPLALSAAVFFSPPDAVPRTAFFEEESWPQHLLTFWGCDWRRAQNPSEVLTSQDAPAELHNAWAPWLDEAVRTAVPPREWPVVAFLARGMRPDPGFIGLAVTWGSDALWAHLARTRPASEVIAWLHQPHATGATTHPEASVGLRLLQAGRRTVFQVLLAAGASLDDRDGTGRTLLHQASSAEEASLLLELGANPTIPDAQGRTVLQHWEKNADPAHQARHAARLAVLGTHRPDTMPSPHARLFSLVLSDASQSDLVAAGWDEAVATVPPLTQASANRPWQWGLLGQVSRTLLSSQPHLRRGDLLHRLLSSRVPRELWSHESLPGCPDAMLALALSTASPQRVALVDRLRAAHAELYPTEDGWTTAFLTAMAARQSAARALRRLGERADADILPSSFQELLVTPFQDKSPARALPYPGWFERLGPHHVSLAAQLVGELWPGHIGAGKTCVFMNSVVRHWNEAERKGDVEGLTDWMPALVGLAMGRALNGLTVDGELARLERWRALGARLGSTHASALECQEPPLGGDATMRDQLLTALAAIRESEALTETLPSASAPRPRARM